MFLLFLCSRRIEELSQSLAAQEKLVEKLSQEKQQLLHLLEEPADMEVQVRFGLYFLRHLLHALRSPTLHINVLVFYCCVNNYWELSGSKQHVFIIPEFLWVKSPGMTELTFLLRVSQV